MIWSLEQIKLVASLGHLQLVADEAMRSYNADDMKRILSRNFVYRAREVAGIDEPRHEDLVYTVDVAERISDEYKGMNLFAVRINWWPETHVCRLEDGAEYAVLRQAKPIPFYPLCMRGMSADLYWMRGMSADLYWMENSLTLPTLSYAHEAWNCTGWDNNNRVWIYGK